MTLPQDWPRCRPWIEAALARGPGLETIDDVERYLSEGSYQLLASPNSAVVIELSQYARRKVLTVIHGGGDLEELEDVVEPALCSIARVNGCTAVMLTGRQGWIREGRKKGYDLAFVVMMKDLAA